MFKHRVLFLLPIVIVLSLILASAQTLITGKIYSQGYSDVVSGADVTVTCGGTLYTNSLDDGTYAVRFVSSICSLGGGVKVKVTKGSLYGESTGIVGECDEDCAESGYLGVLNIMIKPSSSSSSSSSSSGSSSGGGSNGKYYFCGNGKCDSGETITTCPKDCGMIELTNLNNNLIKPEETLELTDENSGTQNQGKQGNFLSQITGAVTGTFGETGSLIAGIFLTLLVILVVFMIIRSR